jgi:hypothetical protein
MPDTEITVLTGIAVVIAVNVRVAIPDDHVALLIEPVPPLPMIPVVLVGAI